MRGSFGKWLKWLMDGSVSLDERIVIGYFVVFWRRFVGMGDVDYCLLVYGWR